MAETLRTALPTFGPFKRSYQRKSPAQSLALRSAERGGPQYLTIQVLDPPGNPRDREVGSAGPKVGAAPKCGQPTHSLLKSGYGKARPDSKVTRPQGQSS